MEKIELYNLHALLSRKRACICLIHLPLLRCPFRALRRHPTLTRIIPLWCVACTEKRALSPTRVQSCKNYQSNAHHSSLSSSSPLNDAMLLLPSLPTLPKLICIISFICSLCNCNSSLLSSISSRLSSLLTCSFFSSKASFASLSSLLIPVNSFTAPDSDVLSTVATPSNSLPSLCFFIATARSVVKGESGAGGVMVRLDMDAERRGLDMVGEEEEEEEEEEDDEGEKLSSCAR